MALASHPSVSFVIATHNRGPILVDCLKKTIAAALPVLGAGRFSISIVDNASQDGTAALVAQLAATEPCVRLIPLQKNCGPVAKNAALASDNADIIVLMDDDAYPLPGVLARMVQHFQEDSQLGAAVFDVTLPDGGKEASAYPDVFIGAGTALRGSALRETARATRAARPGVSGAGFLPADFFMQAEEYDLSFRLLAGGWRVQRFWDMPLLHLKTPGARIGARTTRLDVRNNLWLLARYVPSPLSEQLAADWLARYWQMAVGRDGATEGRGDKGTRGQGERERSHKGAFLRGAAEGLAHWRAQRAGGDLLLNADTLERVFKFDAIRRKLARARDAYGIRRVVFGDWGKNIFPFWRAAGELGIEVVAVLDGRLAAPGVEYRGIPVIRESEFAGDADAIIITAMSRVHAERRAAELRRVVAAPVVDLFSPGMREATTEARR